MRSAARQLFFSRRFLFASGMVVALCCVLFVCIFGFYYAKYHRIVDERLKKPLFDNTAKIYAAPTQLRLGQKYTARFIAQQLRDAGYLIEGDSKTSPLGTYAAGVDSITIHPRSQSFHAPDSATITFENGAIGQITGENGRLLEAYELEPLLVTDLSDQSRAKRRLVTNDELPKTLVQAVTSIEDHRFLKHGGVDYYSMLAWTWRASICCRVP